MRAYQHCRKIELWNDRPRKFIYIFCSHKTPAYYRIHPLCTTLPIYSDVGLLRCAYKRWPYPNSGSGSQALEFRWYQANPSPHGGPARTALSVRNYPYLCRWTRGRPCRTPLYYLSSRFVTQAHEFFKRIFSQPTPGLSCRFYSEIKYNVRFDLTRHGSRLLTDVNGLYDR